MIRLFGVLSTGGVPVHFKSTGGAEEMVLGPLIEASRSLSQMMGSGEVRRLAFKKDTMLLAECEKGYIVVALVTGAEDYMESLLQMVSEAIDESDMPEADGVVTAAHRSIAANIIDRYVVDPPNASFSETIAAIWRPVLSAIRSDPHLNGIEARLNR
ncbi:MAG: hypothetical protein HXY34_10525, partial [Candidatus Thorarchaeota archaeon]|nr:hypothetical protein [Candidatus Thorarchaeota archaeon]